MKKIVFAMAAIVLIALTAICAWHFPGFPSTLPGTRDPIIVGGPALEQSAFLYIAQDQGFFARNGLNVTIRDDYPNGVVPLNDMLEDKLDISVSAEYPIVAAILNGEDIRVIGTIDEYQNEKIIGRKDRGIFNISDLNGKTIGVPRKTICEFFLGRFLNLHGMDLDDVKLVDIPTAQSADAIANGTVDAIIYYQPWVYAIENQLGDNATVWPAQSNQLLYGVMACNSQWIDSRPDELRRFLKSLAQAEEYFIRHPAEAKAIVQKKLNSSDAYIERTWGDHQFSLTLDQSLVIAMNDEARWMISNNLAGAAYLPDINKCIYAKGLGEIKPDAVNIR